MLYSSNSRAAQPNNLLEPLSILIGEWSTAGKHPLMPGVQLTGHTSFKWIEKGAFIRMEMAIHHDQFPDGISIFGTDDNASEFIMLYFDERGVSRKYNCTMENNIWKWWRVDAEFSQQLHCEIKSDGNTMVGKGKMSRNKKVWEDDLELVYTRIESEDNDSE